VADADAELPAVEEAAATTDDEATGKTVIGISVSVLVVVSRNTTL
jgi:hypothetical protein